MTGAKACAVTKHLQPAQGFFFTAALPISYKEKKHMCRFFWPILTGNLAIGCILDGNFNDSSSCLVLRSS